MLEHEPIAGHDDSAPGARDALCRCRAPLKRLIQVKSGQPLGCLLREATTTTATCVESALCTLNHEPCPSQ